MKKVVRYSVQQTGWGVVFTIGLMTAISGMCYGNLFNILFGAAYVSIGSYFIIYNMKKLERLFDENRP